MSIKETDITWHVSRTLGYRTQVKCKAGLVDLVSNTSLIECKMDTSGWKAAVGQLVCYRPYFPSNYTLELWFFCEKKEHVEQCIDELELGIKCLWFPDECYGLKLKEKRQKEWNPLPKVEHVYKEVVKPTLKPSTKQLKAFQKPRLKQKKEKGVTYISSSF